MPLATKQVTDCSILLRGMEDLHMYAVQRHISRDLLLEDPTYACHEATPDNNICNSTCNSACNILCKGTMHHSLAWRAHNSNINS